MFCLATTTFSNDFFGGEPMRKSTLFLLLALLLVSVLALSACGGKATPTQAPAEEKPAATEAPAQMPAEKPTEAPAPTEAPKAEEGKKDFKIGLVTDVGRINDRSFNQSAWEGVKLAAKELGLPEDNIKYIETKDSKDYADNINQFVENGYNVIVTVGFALGDATREAAQNNPDIYFIGVDQFQPEPLPNLAGLIFPEDKAGFLAGVLAASLTKTGTIAAVLGTDLVPPVVAFKEGYEAGARYVNPDIKVISTYHPGELSQAFVDPEWGAATAKQAMDQGADVVFGAGGMTGNGALQEVAAAAEAGKEVYCIGVDTDQWETLPAAHPCLVSSAMKLITPGVAELIKMAYEGNFPGGNYVGDVGLAPFHDFEDKVPQDVKDLLKKVREGLMNGSIDTGYHPGGAAGEEKKEEEKQQEEQTPEVKAPEGFKIGLVTDVGRINDRSFNQSAWEGVKLAAEKLGLSEDDYKYIETKDSKDYADNINQFIENGYNVIVTVGFALGDATREAAQNNPDIYFIGVDQFQPEPLPNLAGLIFPEDKAGFLAGVLAASLTKTGTIAAVLGTDLVPPVVAFKEGYEAGARYVNPDIKTISTYHPGELSQAFVDPEWGAATAKQAMDQGADVVFGAGGMTGNGALQEVAAAAEAGKEVYCIGVDTDQWETLPAAHPCLVSSAMKLITPGVADLIIKAAAGDFPGGNYIGDVGLAPFHDFEDKVPQDVKDLLKEVKKGLFDGSIDTGYHPGG